MYHSLFIHSLTEEHLGCFLSFYLFIYLFILAALGLCVHGLFFVAVPGLLIVVVSLVAEHGL